MKRFTLLSAMIFLLGTLNPAYAEFTGDKKLACEAILCLSTSKKPKECRPAIRKYYSIDHRRLKKTLRNRRNFLKLCPSSSGDENMGTLATAISDGAGRCDANALNSSLRTWRLSDTFVIDNKFPVHCREYYSHSYTFIDSDKPKYVGIPKNGGLWVHPNQYDLALIKYNERIARENDMRSRGRP